MDRRYFLACQAGWVAGLCLPATAGAAVPQSGHAAPAFRLAYLRGSHRLLDAAASESGVPHALEWVDPGAFAVAPGTAPLLAGQTMRVDLRGLQLADGASASERLDLAALYRVPGLAAPLPHHLWQYRGGASPQRSQSLVITGVVGSLLGFSVEAGRATAARNAGTGCANTDALCRLGDSVFPAVWPGFYALLGSRAGRGAGPALRALCWRGDEAWMNYKSGRPRDFDYLMLKISAA